MSVNKLRMQVDRSQFPVAIARLVCMSAMVLLTRRRCGSAWLASGDHLWRVKAAVRARPAQATPLNAEPTTDAVEELPELELAAEDRSRVENGERSNVR